MAKRIMISQPMTGLTFNEVMETRLRAMVDIRRRYPDAIIINTTYGNEIPTNMNIKHTGIYLLGLALNEMSTVDMIYFCDGWKNSKGCHIEHECAIQYNIRILYESDAGRCDHCELGHRIEATDNVTGTKHPIEKGICIAHPNLMYSFYNDIHGSHSVHTRINNCPMCGRKLPNITKT